MHARNAVRSIEKTLTLADSPYTVLPYIYNVIKVDTTGGNVRVNLPDTNYPIDVIKTSSDAYIVTVWVGGTQIGEVAGELSKITIENAKVTKDEPWFPYDAIVGIAGVSGDGGEVLAKDRFGRVIAGGRGVAGTDDSTVIQSALDRLALFDSAVSLCLSPQKYILGSKLTWDKSALLAVGLLERSKTAISIFCPSVKGAILDFSGCVDTPCIDVNPTSSSVSDRTLNFAVRNLTILGNQSSPNNIGMKLYRMQKPLIENVLFYYFKTGLYIYSSYEGAIRDCNVDYCGDTATSAAAMKIEGSAVDVYDATNHLIVDHLSGGASQYANIETVGIVAPLHINHPSIEVGNLTGLKIGALSDLVISGLQIMGGNPAMEITGKVKINGAIFTVVGTYSANTITFGTHGKLKLNGARFSGASTYPTNSFIYTSGADSVNISDSEFYGSAINSISSGGALLPLNIVNSSFAYSQQSPIYLYGGSIENSNIILDGLSFYNVALASGYGIYARDCNFRANDIMITQPVGSRAIYAFGLRGCVADIGNVALSANTLGTWTVVSTSPTFRGKSTGSETGTGSEQTIAHGLAAIPTGCKAWITYLVGTRYVTEMIPFDATNVYPWVDNGVAYTWRIE